MAAAAWKRKGCCCRLLALLLGLALVAAAVGLAVRLSRTARRRCDAADAGAPARFPHAAVAADTGTCSHLGRDVLLQGGSAVDAAIAALICTSVLNPQSMGLGGGVIFTVYNASTGKVEVINARERAPQTISRDLLDHCKDNFLSGAQWIAVPGELRGYEEAHRRYGKLPWKMLFEPTIKLLEAGIRVPIVLNRFLNHTFLQKVLKESSLRKLFYNEQGNILTTGDVLPWPSLLQTLRLVAENGAEEFYTGKVAEMLVEDVQREGGNLTLADLKHYQVDVMKPLNISLGDYTIFSAPRPAGGPILFFIMNVLKGYNFTKEDMKSPSRKTEAYHYIAEALKHANGQKSKVFSDIKEDVINELISDSFANSVREHIDEKGNHEAAHYSLSRPRRRGLGTSHVSVIAEDGSAVSVTSTINYPFGSMVYSERTGIILNNELADFCMRQSSEAILPGEWPPSSMVPSILISHSGQLKLVIGGSGGELITTAVALAIANNLWFGYPLDAAIRAPILYAHGTKIEVEKDFDKDIMKALRAKGHTISVNNQMLNVVQGISKEGPCFFPYSDERKQGKASGY